MKKLLTLLLPAIVLFACNKDEDKTIPHVVSMPLAVGNYWVYEVFNVDSDNVAVSTNQFDTCRITGNEVINGHIYFNFDDYPLIHGVSNPLKLRDSLGYLVDPANKVYFSEANFTTVFNTQNNLVPAFTLSEKMDWKDSTIAVPFGTYNQTATMLGTVNTTEPNYQWGNTRYTYTTYAENTGIIKRRYYFFSSPGYVELRLVNFHQE